MIKEMIKKAAEGIDLTYDEAAEVTREIMTGARLRRDRGVSDRSSTSRARPPTRYRFRHM